MANKIKTWICTGYPDSENFHHQHHTTEETWECQAATQAEAEKKAFEHFYYFHEVLVQEKKIEKKRK